MLAELRISLIHRARMGWKTETCIITAYVCDIVIPISRLTILGFYNARILIHRPLMATSEAQISTDLELHTAFCLEGARETIDLLYEAYSHRHYFRTWYYNSTYTLYASMLVLYVVLINYPHVSSEELIRDVEKSLDILNAMDNVKVAKRCASLISEVLEVVKRQPRTFQDIHNESEEKTGSATNMTHSGRPHHDSVWTDLGSMPQDWSSRTTPLPKIIL